MWFHGNYPGIAIKMTLKQAQSVSHCGECFDDVETLAKLPAIRRQLEKLLVDNLAKELKEYGAWIDADLAHHDTNLLRILWLAGCDIAENHK